MKVNTNFARYAINGESIKLTARWSLIYPESTTENQIAFDKNSGKYIIIINNTLSSSVTFTFPFEQDLSRSITAEANSISYVLLDSSLSIISLSNLQKITWPRPN